LAATETSRLVLSRPSYEDLDALYAIESDPRVWTHYPSLRHVERGQTLALIERWSESWAEIGFGPWIARLKAPSG
jgi:RimJ/RimL family protein N-acetyltransferase